MNQEENNNSQNVSLIRRIWPFLASMGGASVMVLAFFIPSIQDQWDRYQSRKVIEQYESMGDDFLEEERYKMAEDAYAKAYELSLEKRLDIEVKRLTAKVNRINSESKWGAEAPKDLEEVDFQFLLHFQKNNDDQRILTLNSYGRFLVGLSRVEEARDVFEEIITNYPGDFHAYVNMGNILDAEGKKKEAEKMYLKGASLEPENSIVHYNLGLLYAEQGKLKEASSEFEKAVKYDPEDNNALYEYKLILQRIENESVKKR